MTDTNKMRDSFVSACRDFRIAETHMRRDSDGEYIHKEVRAFYAMFCVAWQASRQAVVVELPSFDGYRDFVVRELQAAFTGACEAQCLRVGVKP